MSTTIQLFNTLDDKKFMQIGYRSQPLEASYINEEDEEVSLDVLLLEGQETVYQIEDQHVHWSPDQHELHLQQEIEIAHPGFLFGDNGIVERGSVLGVALRWFSKDSSQINVCSFAKLTSKDLPDKQLFMDINIPKGLLRGKVSFEILLYLHQTGGGSIFPAPGTILGVLESMQLVFDGNSSIFPIVEVNDSDKPLWWINCEFEDASYDQFSEENVAIVINQGHKFSKHLAIKKGLSSNPIILEIIASGLQLIIEKLRNQGELEDILTRGDNEPGSIGEAINYFVNTFSWDISSPEKLAKSIREDFDARFR